MESLIYLIWPSQIKKKGKDACVLEMEATCKSNFFWGKGGGKKDTRWGNKEQSLLETF